MSDETATANVIPFPDRGLQAWKVMERLLRENLEATTSNSPAQIATLCDRLRPIYVNATETEYLHITPDQDRLSALNQWAANLFFALLWQIAIREMKLLNANLE